MQSFSLHVCFAPLNETLLFLPSGFPVFPLSVPGSIVISTHMSAEKQQVVMELCRGGEVIVAAAVAAALPSSPPKSGGVWLESRGPGIDPFRAGGSTPGPRDSNGMGSQGIRTAEKQWLQSSFCSATFQKL